MPTYAQLGKYRPLQAPKDPNQLPAYVQHEFQRLANLLNQSEAGSFPQQYVAPSKVQDGDIYLADGTEWNPCGVGKGFVYWSSADGGAWHSFNAATEIKYTNGSGKTVEDLYIQGVSANQITATSIAAGSVTASAISVTSLSAITANIGSLTVNRGGSLSSGMTGYNTNPPGFWIGTDSFGNPQISIVDQFGNFILFDGSSSNPISISSLGITGVLSANQIDSGSWSQTAQYNSIGGLPTTLDGYGINNGQTTLPLGTFARQVLRNDGGAFYTDNQYSGGECDAGLLQGNNFLSANASLSTSGYATIGNTITVPKAIGAITILAFGSLCLSSTSTSNYGNSYVEISMDGGVTWTQGNNVNTSPFGTNESYFNGDMYCMVTGVPTGNILIRMQGERALAGAAVITAVASQSALGYMAFASSNGVSSAATLSATVPGTASMSCSSNYPTTSCTATKNISVSVTGLAPFTYSWTSTGTGSITAGASSATCTVSDTETTTTGGATHNTTATCKVTDSQNYTGATATASAGVATVTIGTHGIPIGAKVTNTGFSVSNYNGTFTVTNIGPTTIQFAVTGTPGSATGGVVGTVNVTSSGCVVTGTFQLNYRNITATISTSPGSCYSATCGPCTAISTATANPNYGNFNYTYSWTVISGTGVSITAGASSATVTAHCTLTGNTGRTGVLQCSVSDTRGTNTVTPQCNLGFSSSCP